MNNTPVCEVCGKTAQFFVQDTRWFNNHKLGIIAIEPYGLVHSFCLEHKRDSISEYGGDTE